jgi:hypothetical protein
MGLFDYVRSSYPLPEPFMNVNQTKDLGESMVDYWIDPSGLLWYGDYVGCHTLEFIEEGDPRYEPKAFWANHTWVRTGVRGTFQVHSLTDYVEIYPECYDGRWEDWPLLRLHFRRGRLLDWEDVTGR